MINFIRKILGLCQHKWIEDGREEYVDTSFGIENPFTRIQCQCENCGKWKTFSIKK